MIIAVDFDGTLYRNGAINRKLLDRLRREQQRGGTVILWSCREGERLRQAVDICRKNGLAFDHVNRNAPEALAMLGHDPRKIYADVYVDDKALRLEV